MRVWPTSRNIPIREIEDRLLLFLAQTYFFRDMLVFETVNDQNWSANTSAFQIVIGADGAGSLTRQHVFGMSDMVTHGEDTALGIAFKVPKNECNHHRGLPFVLYKCQLCSIDSATTLFTKR